MIIAKKKKKKKKKKKTVLFSLFLQMSYKKINYYNPFLFFMTGQLKNFLIFTIDY